MSFSRYTPEDARQKTAKAATDTMIMGGSKSLWAKATGAKMMKFLIHCFGLMLMKINFTVSNITRSVLDLFDRLRRVAGNHRPRRHVPRHHRSRAHHRVLADRNTVQDDRAGAYPRALLDFDPARVKPLLADRLVRVIVNMVHRQNH